MPGEKNAFGRYLTGGLLLSAAWLAALFISRFGLPFYYHLIALPLFLALLLLWLRPPAAVPAAPQPEKTPDYQYRPEPTSAGQATTTNSSRNPGYSQPLLNEALAHSFTLQLKLLCHGLNLTTAILVTENQEHDTLNVRAAYSEEELEFAHSFPANSGVFVGLRQGRHEITGQPSSPLFQGLPYYPQGHAVGSFYALSLERLAASCPTAYLCVDRAKADSWSATEKKLLTSAAAKISYDIYLALQLADFDRDKKATNQVCLALQELNAVLGLAAAFQATESAVRNLTDADFVAITLINNQRHTVVVAKGAGAEELEGTEVSEDTCLVNQAMRMQRTMPPRPTYNGPAPIFSQDAPLTGFNSLLILPLIIKQEEPIGTLIVAGHEPQLFTRERQNILELIAAQIATKIDLSRAHEKVFQLASTDGLTGLANRRTFQSAMGNMIDRAHRQSSKMALLLCDIDHFKQVNDTYGHPFGDEALRHVATILHEAVRSTDLAARYGGEEFAVLLENSNEAGAKQLAERIRSRIETLRLVCDATPVQLTISLGIALYPDHGKEPEALLARADQALYAAKESGRNQVRSWPI